MALEITDLPVDVLSHILSSVAKSSDGATDFVTSMIVCKRFLEAGINRVVLKSVCFKKVEVASRYPLFQRIDGLLYHCARAGNLHAQFLLAQVLFKTCTQLVRAGIKKYNNSDHIIFQEEFFVAYLAALVAPGPLFFHCELVKFFLSNCTAIDIVNFQSDIQNYVGYFMPSPHIGSNSDAFFRSLRSMCDPESKYFMLMICGGRYYYLVNGMAGSQVFIENAVVEEMRFKALEAFDRVSRGFLGFVVPGEEE